MVKNNYIPRSIVKQYDGIECTYILAKVEHSKEIANQIESLNNEALFGKIVEKYFILGRDRFCASAEIKELLRKQSILDEDILLAGFNFKSDIQYCHQYRAFLKYIACLDGVKESRFQDKRGFTGIKLKEITCGMYDSNQENESVVEGDGMDL